MRVDWSKSLVSLSSEVSVANVLSLVGPAVKWVVFGDGDLLFALARREIERFAEAHPDRIEEAARLAFRLDEVTASRKFSGDDRPEQWLFEFDSGVAPSQSRVVAVDRRGRATEVGAADIPAVAAAAARSLPKSRERAPTAAPKGGTSVGDIVRKMINAVRGKSRADSSPRMPKGAVRPRYFDPEESPRRGGARGSTFAPRTSNESNERGGRGRSGARPSPRSGGRATRSQAASKSGPGSKKHDDKFLGVPKQDEARRPEPTTGATPVDLVPSVLSATAPRALQVGKEEVVDVRVELKEGATPLANAITADIQPYEKIRVILSARHYDVLSIESRTVLIDPPAQGDPREVRFVIKGLKPGESELAVSFQQGGTELGAVRFKLKVSEATVIGEAVEASVNAVARNAADDDVLQIQVDGVENPASPRFKYRVSSRLLGLESAYYESREFKPTGNSPRAALEAFISRIYEDLTRRLSSSDDVVLFQREVMAIGMDLCQQLFSPELARLLWSRRKDIKAIKIVSFEPSIPWELVRLQNPDTNEVDDKHLCEYGLVRSISGRRGASRIGMKDWRTVTAEYPNKSLPDVAGQMRILMQRLAARGINATVITPEPLKLLEALERDKFDVLHIACHGESDTKAIDNATIILSDRPPVDGKPAYVSINARTLASVPPRSGYSPLVFVNACETGKQAASLTDWGGLPSAFWDMGAGAYVGTSWSVRETPAREFAEAFYESLLSGSTLAEASTKAREKAKFGDASWLAYTVYGDPTSMKA